VNNYVPFGSPFDWFEVSTKTFYSAEIQASSLLFGVVAFLKMKIAKRYYHLEYPSDISQNISVTTAYFPTLNQTAGQDDYSNYNLPLWLSNPWVVCDHQHHCHHYHYHHQHHYHHHHHHHHHHDHLHRHHHHCHHNDVHDDDQIFQ